MVDVTVDRGEEGRVEPSALTVTSFVLRTVDCDGVSVMMVVDLVGEEVNDAAVVDGEGVEVLSSPSMEATSAAACEAGSLEVVDVDVEVVLDVVVEVVGVLVVDSEEELGCVVTVTVSVASLCDCGTMKFGAILIAGCAASSQRHPAEALMPGKMPAGAFLYSPMTVYAKRRVLSKSRITTIPTNIGVDRVTPLVGCLRCGTGKISGSLCAGGGVTPKRVEKRGGWSFFSDHSMSSASMSGVAGGMGFLESGYVSVDPGRGAGPASVLSCISSLTRRSKVFRKGMLQCCILEILLKASRCRQL